MVITGFIFMVIQQLSDTGHSNLPRISWTGWSATNDRPGGPGRPQLQGGDASPAVDVRVTVPRVGVWPKFASAPLLCRLMVTAPAQIKVSTILWVFVALNCLNGFSLHAPLSGCMDKEAAQPESMMNGLDEEWRMSVPGFSAAICSGPCVALGRTIRGKDGGVRNRPIMCRRLS